MPFKKPEVAPATEEEYAAFDELDDVLQDYELSRAVGWVVQLKKVLSDKQEVRHVRTLLHIKDIQHTTGPFYSCVLNRYSG